MFYEFSDGLGGVPELSDAVTGEKETVPADEEAPVLVVPNKREIYIGEPISYKSDITLTDNADPDPALEIDISYVDTEAEGVYPVFYTATDDAGNIGVAVSALYVKPLELKSMAEETERMVKEVADAIITDGMTDTQKARAVFNWVTRSIAYAPKSVERDLVSAGYTGFTKHAGDCYINFACAKLLLDYIGIPNIEVERLKTGEKQTNHYWLLVNTGSGWYHFDAAPFSSADPFNGFMRTDAEIEAYAASLSDGRVWYYHFDKELYSAYPRETTAFRTS
ncbi:MAG: hypothetical protein IJR00_02330 [Lachnospiraceae bacterium]|nr:hypothetical protein [Lachnospiraceae bacterium]